MHANKNQLDYVEKRSLLYTVYLLLIYIYIYIYIYIMSAGAFGLGRASKRLRRDLQLFHYACFCSLLQAGNL